MNFSPEMIAMAQKQMESMSPEQLAEMQKMAMQMDPSKLAALGLDPAAAKQAQEQFSSLSPEDMARAREQMKNMTPEEMQKQFQQQQSTMAGQRDYYYKASVMLKNDGNDLVKAGKYAQAEEKYRRAASNLESDSTPAGRELRTACQLNLALCLLKLSKPAEAEQQCTDVLRRDKSSLKAYFRRGQARLQRNALQDAASDLRKAAAISPGDETVQTALKECLEKMSKAGMKEDASAATPEPEPIEEIVTPAAAAAGANFGARTPEETRKAMEEMKKNPEMLKNMGEMMSNMSEEQLKAISRNAPPGMPEVTPELAKQAAEMMKSMSPEDMERMMEMAQKMGPLAGMGGAGAGAGGDRAASGAAASGAGGGMPSITPEMMEKMGETMKDPKMMEMVSNMMKDISPETLAAMSKSAGMNLSEEQAKVMAEQMKNIKPEQMAKIMAAAGVMQKLYQRFVQAREWARRNRTLLLFVVVVLFAFVVQWWLLRKAARRELEEALAATKRAAGAGLKGAVPGAGGEEEEDPFAAGAAEGGAAWGPR